MKAKIKKLRGKGYVEIDPQILRWREKRKKLGLYKPARKPKQSITPLESPTIENKADLDPTLLWDMYK
jgi:hypothetical protein